MHPDPFSDSQLAPPSFPSIPEVPSQPASIAPTWHTIVLIAAIVAVSANGATRVSLLHGSVHRFTTYAATAAMELAMLAWVAFGLHLKKIPLRSLLGENSFSPRALLIDIGIALAFWIGSLMVLGSLAITWAAVQASIEHRNPLVPNPQQQQAVHAMAQLAPTTAVEIAAWTLLCMLVGVCEETIFRGYLQTQFTRWGRGAVGVGIALSALVFGGAHAYQGVRNMVLLAVFGALFSGLVLLRRSLRAAIFAHAWHDLITGLALALLNSRHLI